jgi:hypothetical protein
MDYAVKLAKPPSELTFPQRLSERVRYDPDRCELIYRGFMTKCTYDELSGLSDDVDYHRALEKLFVLTSADAMPTPARRFPMAAIAAGTIGAAAIAAGAFWVTTRHTSADKAASQPEPVVATSSAR